MEKAVVVFTFVLFACYAQSQNLVPNGSFEQYYSCPTSTGQVDSCIGWHKFGGIVGAPGTPDYFNSCATSFVGVPDNIFGNQMAFEGNGYVGLYTFDNSYWYREYIGTKLLDTLVSGNNYNISLRVSRANVTDQVYACVATNKLGMRFTTFSYSYGSIIPVNNYVQIFEDSIITDTLNWILLNWNFTADSAYTNIYIGNFFESDSTDTLQINCPMPPGRESYYFIDSVNIVCISQNCSSGVNEVKYNDPKIFYNFLNGSLYIEGIKQQFQFELYNEAGQLVWKKPIEENELINISDLSAGFYIAILKTANKIIYKKLIKY